MTVETLNSASEFLFENDAPEILLNNLLSFNERTEAIINLTADIERYGTDAQKHYLPYFKSAIEFCKQNQRFPNLAELNGNCNSEPVPERNEVCADAAYTEITSILHEEQRVAEFRSALRSKDVGRIADFAKSLQPSAPLPEVDIEKILDIKALRRKGRENQKFPIISGIKLFDNEVQGFRNKTLNTITAPSGGGKTTLAVNMAYNNALKGNLVVYCALESSAEEILASFISLAYKRKWKKDTSFLAEEFKPYRKSILLPKIEPGTINSIRFYQLSQEVEDLLIDNYQSAITANGGNIYVIDDSCCDLRSIESLTKTVEAIAEKENRKVDLLIFDNADDLSSFSGEGKSEADMTMVNRRINQLNAYSTTHYNGAGTTILFLAQFNRTGITELNKKDKPDISYTHISTYSNLYSKASVVASISKSKKYTTALELRLLKNRHGKCTGDEDPKYIFVEFEYSYIDGDNVNVNVNTTPEENTDDDDLAEGQITGDIVDEQEQIDVPPLGTGGDLSDISLEDDWDDDMTVS